MARNKEVCVFLLDVGRKSSPFLDDAKAAGAVYLTSKMLFKASHEVAVYLFGTNGTENSLHREFADQEDADLYSNISELTAIKGPVPADLQQLAAISSGDGKVDFMDALTVAIDLLYKALAARPELEKATVTKRIILLSALLDKVVQDDDFAAFQSELQQKMEAHNIYLSVYCLGEETENDDDSAVPTENLAILNSLSNGREPCIARGSMEIRGLFPLKEYSATAYYSGPLMFGDKLIITVKVVKKVAQERMPGMNRFSEVAHHDQAQNTVSMDRTFRRSDAEENGNEEEYAPEDMGKAYQYGAQIVPMAREQELALKYSPEKGFHVLGVVPQSSAPHSLWAGDTWCIAPEKGNADSFTALGAIAVQLQEAEAGLLARFVPRANGDVTLGLILPHSARRDCLIMTALPAEADVRAASFTTFSKKPEVLPTKQQTAALESILDELLLERGQNEARRPEMTANPVLHKLLQEVTARSIEPAPKVECEDFISKVLNGEAALNNKTSLKALKDHFAFINEDSQVEETLPQSAAPE